MHQNILIEPLQNIEFDDVVSFLKQQVSENVSLDYKAQLTESDKLSKTIASFANTLGGLIIVGVNEDGINSKPLPPYDGIPEEKHPIERILQIINSNIYPPVSVDISQTKPNSKGNVFILVRVPESHQAPHAIAKNTKVYIRTGNITDSEELADIERLEWLSEKRKKSEFLREQLLLGARDRANNVAMVFKKKISPANIEILAIPTYPRNNYSTPRQIYDDLIDNIATGQFSERTPQIDTKETIQNGMIGFKVDNDKFNFFCELNTYGLYFINRELGEIDNTTKELIIHMSPLYRIIGSFFVSSLRWFNKIKYEGLLTYRIELNNIGGATTQFYNKTSKIYSSTLIIERTKPKHEIMSNPSAFIANMISELMWSIGLYSLPDGAKLKEIRTELDGTRLD